MIDGMQKQAEASRHVDQGAQFMMEGRYAEAEEELKKAIQVNPFNATAHGNMGGVFLKQERYEEAIPWLEKALELNPRLEGVPQALAQARATINSQSMPSKDKIENIIKHIIKGASKHETLGRLVSTAFFLVGFLAFLVLWLVFDYNWLLAAIVGFIIQGALLHDSLIAIGIIYAGPILFLVLWLQFDYSWWFAAPIGICPSLYVLINNCSGSERFDIFGSLFDWLGNKIEGTINAADQFEKHFPQDDPEREYALEILSKSHNSSAEKILVVLNSRGIATQSIKKYRELRKQKELRKRNKMFKKKKREIALGAAFISCINETIQSVQSGSHNIHKASLDKDVIIKTHGCQLRANDLDIMNTAVKIALNEALDVVSNNNAEKKDQILSELWPGSNNIMVTLSLTPEKKFVLSLDLD